MTDKTTEALKLAEALEHDAKEHREVSYGLDCPPERTANWKHALNCEAAARLIREALAEPVKQEPVAIVDEIGKRLDGTYIFNAVGKVDVGQPLYAAPVDAKAIRAEALEGVVKFLSESGLITPTGRFAAAISGLK